MKLLLRCLIGISALIMLFHASNSETAAEWAIVLALVLGTD